MVAGEVVVVVLFAGQHSFLAGQVVAAALEWLMLRLQHLNCILLKIIPSLHQFRGALLRLEQGPI